MRVMFLDVDGVLNSGSLSEKNTFKQIDRKNVSILKEIIEKTGAIVVLSSGWKFFFDDEMKPVTEEAGSLYDVLSDFGITLFGKTPDYSTEEIRRDRTFSKVKAKEIKAWLYEHKDVESFIVLDDLDLNDAVINQRTIQTNSLAGLTNDDARRAIGMLMKCGIE